MKKKLEPVKKPNLFLLGAAKSGTTSLHYYMNQHPDIFLTDVKEPYFFSKHFSLVPGEACIVDYFKLYENAKDEKYRGEATHGYLTDEDAAPIIAALFPDAKFILILRNPVERAYSLYNFQYRGGIEPNKTFEKALKAEDSRMNSDYFRKNCPEYYYNYFYFNSGLYGEQIERYFQLFDPSQFLFLRTMDMKSDLDATLQKIWEFLDIDPKVPIEAEKQNVGKPIKSPMLRKIANHKLLNNTGLKHLGINDFVHKINVAENKPMKEDTRKMLVSAYQEDLKKLKNLTGISWEANKL